MKELQWGETPFDNKSKEELQLLVKKMYSALISVNHYNLNDSTSSKKIKEILSPIHQQFKSEEIYRSYFRYADDLLFENPELSSKWHICPICNRMNTSNISYKDKTCSEVFFTECQGIVRPIEWGDLKPIDNN